MARVGDQVDTSVNPNQIGVGTIVDPAAPTFNLSTIAVASARKSNLKKTAVKQKNIK